MNFKKDTEEYERRADELDKVKYKCNCGHRVIIPKYIDKQLCDWCGNYVFREKSEEFKYRIQEKLRRINERRTIKNNKSLWNKAPIKVHT